MPTISQMMGGTYQMYKYAQKNGENIFKPANNANKTSSSSLWNSYSSSLSSAGSTMSGLLGIRSSVNDMVKNYNTTKNTFNMELGDTLDDLKKSIDKVKTLDFKVDPNSENAAETTSELVSAVKDFADNYNDAIKFFNDNSSVSRYVKNMGRTFSDTTYSSGSAMNIGIKIDSTGKMTVDEEKLTQIISSNPTRVNAVMDTLTNKADRHVSFAKSQQNRLFPSMQTMLGSSFKSASVYSGNSLMRIANYSNVGSLFNYFV